jgi:two-component system, LytTR family, response regulator
MICKTRGGKTEILLQTLEGLKQQLDPKAFFRANRQLMVHINAVKQLHNLFNGKLKIELKNNPDIEVVVSSEKAQLLKAWMDY